MLFVNTAPRGSELHDIQNADALCVDLPVNEALRKIHSRCPTMFLSLIYNIVFCILSKPCMDRFDLLSFGPGSLSLNAELLQLWVDPQGATLSTNSS